MKKLTLKERQDALRKWTSNLHIAMHDQFIATRPNVIFADDYLKDGEYYLRIQCEECGKTSLIDRLRRDTKCPICGNKLFAHYIEDRNHKLLLEENDDGWRAVIYDVRCSDARRRNQDISEIEFQKRVDVSVRIGAVLQYEKAYGFLVYAKNYSYAAGYQEAMSFVNPNSQRYADVVRNFRNHKDKSINMNEKIQSAMDAFAAFKQEAYKNKTLNKSQVSEIEQMCYQPKELDIDQMIKFPKFMLYDRYNQTENGMIYAVSCSVCGSKFHSDAVGVVKCPKCGTENKLMEERSSYHYPTKTHESVMFLHYENTNLSDNEILLRVFSANYNLTKNGDIDVNVAETKRYFFGSTQKKAYDVRQGQLVKTKADFAKTPGCCRQIAAHTSEELCEIFDNSALKYSGAMEAMGCRESAHQPVADINSLAYLQAWYQNHGIEYIFKSQLRELTYDLLKNGGLSKFPKNSSNVREVLGLTNMGVQIMRHYDLGVESLDSVRDICQNDPTITLEGFQQLQDSVSLIKATDIIREFHISWKDVVDYIDDVYMHQCIEKEDAIEVWYDYLNMATKIGLDLSDRDKKFPSSLRKEHDIASFAYKSVKSDIDAEEFARQAQSNKERYAYEYDDFVAIVPETAEEVVQEASNQHNCLRSYVDAIKNGRTAVAFIRRKSSPKKSYVSVEVRGNALVQIKGFANSNPRTIELSDFLTHWCEDKGLNIACFY